MNSRRIRQLAFVLASISCSIALADSSYLKSQSERAFKLRDPFKRPQLVDPNAAVARSDLESFALSELRLVGVMTGPDKIRAMIQAPNGKTYFVSENARIGTRKGVIQKIGPSGIVVREKIVNVLGDEEDVRITMSLTSGTPTAQKQ